MLPYGFNTRPGDLRLACLSQTPVPALALPAPSMGDLSRSLHSSHRQKSYAWMILLESGARSVYDYGGTYLMCIVFLTGDNTIKCLLPEIRRLIPPCLSSNQTFRRS